MELFYSSKNFRLFFMPMEKSLLQISISKKNFKKAVERNKLKRRIREIFRKSSFVGLENGMVVFSVFKPFGELSYSNAVHEVESAVNLFVSEKNKNVPLVYHHVASGVKVPIVRLPMYRREDHKFFMEKNQRPIWEKMWRTYSW